jgi:hypothetical protein
MKLDSNKHLLDNINQAVTKARYITDIRVSQDDRNIEVYAYTKIPVLGRIWSFLRHVFIRKNDQIFLKQQATNFKDYHETKAKKYINSTIDSPEENKFQDLIKIYDYFQVFGEISNRLLNQQLQPFHAIALEKFETLDDEELQDVENELSKGNLQAATAKKEEILTLSKKVTQYVAVPFNGQIMSAITTKQTRLQNILSTYDALEKIEEILGQNQLNIEGEEKIPGLNAIIEAQPGVVDKNTKAFAVAMEALIPHLQNHYPATEVMARDFCANFKLLNKKIACEQAIDAFSQELMRSPDPEKLVCDEEFQTEYERISSKAEKYEITEKFEALKSEYEFWENYNQLTTLDEEISFEELNQDGLFDALMEKNPSKIVALIAKLNEEEKDTVIQKLLPVVEQFKNEQAKKELFELANKFCIQPQFVKNRIEKVISDKGFNPANFEKHLENVLKSFLKDPSKVANDPKVQNAYKAVTEIDENDLAIYSETLPKLCDALKDEMEFWERYEEMLVKLQQGSIPEDFKTFVDKLIESSPRNALTLLAYVPEKNGNQQNIKKDAFMTYLKWYSEQKNKDASLLMPNENTEKQLFLESASRLGIFNAYDVFKDIAMPEFVIIHAREAGKLFCRMIDDIIDQLEEYQSVIKNLEALKGIVAKTTPKRGAGAKIDFVQMYRKNLIDILSDLPPNIADMLKFPSVQSLEWNEPYQSKAEGKEEEVDVCPIQSLALEIRFRSLAAAILNDKKNKYKDLSLQQTLGLMSIDINVDRPLVCKVMAKLNYKKDDIRILVDSYKGTKPFHDLLLRVNDKDAFLKNVCDSIFDEIDSDVCIAIAREIQDQKIRDDLLLKIAIKLAINTSSLNYQENALFPKALGIGEALGQEQKNKFFEAIALEKNVKMNFAERFAYAQKVSRPWFGKSPRDKVLVQLLEERTFWNTFEHINLIMKNIKDKSKFDAQFLDIVTALCKHQNDIKFAASIANYITNDSDKDVAIRLIKGSSARK